MGMARLALFNKTNKVVSVSVTKALAAAENYAANDVLSESVSAGTVWNFANVAGKAGASGKITRAVLTLETDGLTPAITLYLFHTAPTSELDDNEANTAILHADVANYIGRIDFPALESLGGGDSQAIATRADGTNIDLPFKCASADTDLYGIMLTRDAITGETATDDLICDLLVERD